MNNFCMNCGTKLDSDSKFCSKCGAQVSTKQNENKHENQTIRNRIGFSPRINDPAFERYKSDSKKYSYIFAFILAIIAIISFPIYGKSSGDIEWPYSLYYGFGIGGMFIVIAFFQSLSRSIDSTWDGVVINKDSYVERKQDRYSDSYSNHRIYKYEVKRDNGKVYTHYHEDDDTIFNYYSIGDKVRHHKGFGGYEKYDKSRDKFIICTACGWLNELTDDCCKKCKCPLLK